MQEDAGVRRRPCTYEEYTSLRARQMTGECAGIRVRMSPQDDGGAHRHPRPYDNDAGMRQRPTDPMTDECDTTKRY
jgi:hypothetical protein